jgi:flavin reductase (DIM6/NTAB) family NADH-FMN oxidoreductase RutF
VTSVSADPPLLLVCVDLNSRTLPAIRHSGRFVVNFMAVESEAVCLLFASKAEDKFAEISWEHSESGMPVLHEHTLAWADCSIERELEVGDHVVFVGSVDAGAVAPLKRAPIAYYARTFDRLHSLAAATERSA